MKKALIELWNTIPNNSETSKTEEELLSYLDRHKTDIGKNLDVQGKESLEKLEDCYSELFQIGCEDAFAQGFSLAVKLMTESLS